MPLREHGCDVTAPVTADPAETLVEVFGTVLERSPNLCLFVVLHANFPLVKVEPPCDEVIIVSVQLACSPSLIGEAMREGIVLQDATPVGHGTT